MASATGEWAWMAEVAGEELEKLEAAHPGRFGPLKAELKRLIAEPGWDAAAFPLISSDGGGATATCSASRSPPMRSVCTQGLSFTCVYPSIRTTSGCGHHEMFCRVFEPEEEVGRRRRG